MTTTPIQLDLTAGDTKPSLVYTIRNPDGTAKNITAGTISATLYYFNADDDPVPVALWKKVLTKSGTPTDGKVTFNPSGTEAYYPAAVIALGGGVRQFKGWIRYIDTDVLDPVDEWIKDVLRVTAELPPAEPV